MPIVGYNDFCQYSALFALVQKPIKSSVDKWIFERPCPQKQKISQNPKDHIFSFTTLSMILCQ